MPTKALLRFPCGCCFEKINDKHQLVIREKSCKIRHGKEKRVYKVRGQQQSDKVNH